MAALGGFYLVFALAFPDGMGMGDVKFAAFAGLYLGWLGWQVAFVATLLCFFAAAIYVLARRLIKSSGHRVLPLVPFIAGGALAAIWIFGPAIVRG